MNPDVPPLQTNDKFVINTEKNINFQGNVKYLLPNAITV